jgi:Tfp pilus assembly protein PilF
MNPQIIAMIVSVGAMLLGILNFVLARKNDRQRDELQQRNDRIEADRLLDAAWVCLYGPEGYQRTRDKARLEEGRMAIRRAEALEPNYPRAVEYQGYLLECEQNRTAARKKYERSVQLAPRRYNAHLCLARTLDGDAKLGELNLAIECEPFNSPEAHSDIASEMLRRDDVTSALAYIELAIAQRPAYSSAHTQLARVYVRTGDLAEARVSYEKAISADPHSIDPIVELGGLLTQLGDWEEGITWINRAMSLDPRDDYPYALMAAIHADRKEPAIALQFFQRAAEINPQRRLTIDTTSHELLQSMRKLLEETRISNPMELQAPRTG